MSIACDSGPGGDDLCVAATKDPNACCFSMTLRNIPVEPTPQEQSVLLQIVQKGLPIYENTEEHLCITKAARDEVAHQFNEKDEWWMLPKGQTTMYYKAFCDLASFTKIGAISLSAALLATAY